MSEKGLRIEVPVHIKRDRRVRNVIALGESPKASDPVPRLARLLALAHKWEGMVRRGEIKDYAEIARTTRLSRARVTQIVGLTLLTPDIQERILIVGASLGDCSLPERALRSPSRRIIWSQQQDTILALVGAQPFYFGRPGKTPERDNN